MHAGVSQWHQMVHTSQCVPPPAKPHEAVVEFCIALKVGYGHVAVFWPMRSGSESFNFHWMSSGEEVPITSSLPLSRTRRCIGRQDLEQPSLMMKGSQKLMRSEP